MASKLIPVRGRDRRGRYVELKDKSRGIGRIRAKKRVWPSTVLKMLERTGVK